MQQNKKKLFLLDAMALIYRAYYAINRNPRINSKGLNTSAILGFTNSLFEIINNESPSHIGVAFDTKSPTIRHKDFADYKANREKMPEDIAIAIPFIKQIIKAFNIPVIELDGYEADDIIGTLSVKAEIAGYQVFMMTPDKDFGQVVSENIFQYKPARLGNKPEIFGIEEVCSKFGIKRTEQVKDILGLWGDSSDNIPGVPGIGEVNARKIIEEWDSIENLIENRDKIKNNSLRNKIIEYSEQALKSKQLATIITNAPIPFDEKLLELKDPNFDNLKNVFDELEFKNLANRIFSKYKNINNQTSNIPADLFAAVGETLENAKKNINNSNVIYKLISSEEDIKILVSNLLSTEIFCFDTETSGLNTLNDELVGISFAFKKNEAFYIPLNQSNISEILQLLKPVFSDKAKLAIGHNLKFDISMLHNYDINIECKLFDTMIAHYLIEPEQRHNMDYLALTYLDYQTIVIESLIGKKGKNQLSMLLLQPEQIKNYACEDADITFQLYEILELKLKENNLLSLFNEIEIPLIKVLVDMEKQGVNLDIMALNEYSIHLKNDIIGVENEIFALTGEKFNIASPKQLGEVIFEKLKLSYKPKRTKTKQYSTSEEVLQNLKHKHPAIEKILEYRSLTKLKSTYVDALPLLVNKKTNRLHTSYNQTVTSTGRLSSNNPNLQNIPIRTERGREIRKSFIAKDNNHLILAADYSQIELRIIAHISEDSNMIAAFNSGYDIHLATAAKIFNTDINNVSPDMRRIAKTTNFGIIYGISAFGLAQQLNITRTEAVAIIEQYFTEFPGVKNYMNNIIKFANSNGFVETLKHRRRYLRDINSANAIVRGFAERNAINAPIQGTSADMIKIAMINIYNKFKLTKLKSKMILQVHDELVFDVAINEIDIVKTIVEEEMKAAIKLSIPIVVEIKVGGNWLEAH